MKKVAEYKGIPIYTSPDVPEGKIYMVNTDKMERIFPTKKDGKPDMRYSINKLQKAFDRASGISPHAKGRYMKGGS